MSVTDSLLKDICITSRDPVVRIENGKVVFSNRSAVIDLGITEGMSALQVIPEHILNEGASRFVSSAVISGKSVSVSAFREDSALLLIAALENNGVNSSASRLSSNLSYSIGSDMSTMRMAADRIMEKIDPASDSLIASYSSILYHSYYKLLRITENISLVGHILSGTLPFSPRETDLVKVCSDIVNSVSLFIRESNIDISFECSYDSIMVKADVQLIERMLLNLISNSIIHCPPGGTIKLSLKKSESNAVISVDDTGSGIPQDILPGIFSRFEQQLDIDNIAKGPGLGLFLAKSIAELHGGALIIESREGHGTSVRVLISLHTESSLTLHDSGDIYSPAGPNVILTELSPVLGHEFYCKKYMD